MGVGGCVTSERRLRWTVVQNIDCNWLGGTLSGPKRRIFRHTSPIFLIVALLRPTKIRFVWQKMATFLSPTRPHQPVALALIHLQVNAHFFVPGQSVHIQAFHKGIRVHFFDVEDPFPGPFSF